MNYTKEQLEQMPIGLLRNLDISCKEDETLVQSILNSRVEELPLPNVINGTSAETDKLTAETEKELQARLDAQNKALRDNLILDDLTSEEKSEIKSELKESIKFCEFCDAKGPISHKKNCTRPR